MLLEELSGQSLPLTVFNSDGSTLTVTAFNSQALLVLTEDGEESVLPTSTLSSLSLGNPNQSYTVYLNVYPSKVGTKTFSSLEQARAKASSNCIGQKEVVFNLSELSA